MTPMPIPEELNDRPGVPIAGHAPGLPAWEAARASARKSLIIGAIIIAIGLAISIGTYVAAASNPNGGHYFLAFGPVIVGVLALFRGFRAWNAAGPRPAAMTGPSDSLPQQAGAAVAGWYLDPSDSSQLRWWDGAAWTPHLHKCPSPESTTAT
jgi:Protein of unknown function (DUF2510)